VAVYNLTAMAGLPEHPATIEFGRFKVVRHRRELLADGRPVELGARAFETLVALIDARGTVLGKDELMRRVWPDRIVEENNLAAQVSTLRKVFGADRHLIRTVARRGYQFTGEIRATATDAAATLSRVRNLPEALSELIGREAELRDALDLVMKHRLVTLVGAGGIGKTRLGLEVARGLLPRFPDGVFVAELGPLSSPELVPATVATALSLTLGAGTVSREGIAAAVGTKRLLLIVDNCEHLIEAAADMVEALLRASPAVSLLATSREPLRASGEYVYRVPPLAVPPEDSQDTEDVLRYGAVRLFVSRARAAEPQYVPDVRRAAATATICRHLDGIPLAIELAAARVAAFGVEGVAARLGDRFHLLTGGRRTALPRQQTLRATLDWSHELLSETERVVLRRLAVFAGVFTLEAASAVAASADVPAQEVVDCVANLVAKSLLSTDVAGAIVHYRLLETTRAYAREKLIESGELERFARRHAEYHRALFERADAEWETRPTAEWLAAYRPQIDNLRAALDWAFSPGGDATVGVELTVATVPLWMRLALIAECRLRVEQGIAHRESEVPADAGRDMRLFLALGIIGLHTQDPGSPKMVAALTRALDLAESLDDADYRLRAMWGLCVYRFRAGDYQSALMLAEQFRTLAAKTADPFDDLIGDRLIGIGLHVLGDQPGARRHVEPLVSADFATARVSHILRYQYDQRVVTHCHYAKILWLQGCADQAMHIAKGIVDHARTEDHVLSLLYALVQAGCAIAVNSGDLETAEGYVKVVGDLAVKHALEAWRMWGQCFEGVVLIKRGDSAAGSRLLGAALRGLPEGVLYLNRNLFAELAAGLGASGQIAEGLALVDDVLARVERTQERWCLAELLRRKGELLRGAPSAVTDAEGCFQQALEVARRQDALSWELRAATSLARLWHGQRRTSQARKVLAPVYGRFTEGFETADLIAAKTLLASLR